jgi:hypothetical protein
MPFHLDLTRVLVIFVPWLALTLWCVSLSRAPRTSPPHPLVVLVFMLVGLGAVFFVGVLLYLLTILLSPVLVLAVFVALVAMLPFLVWTFIGVPLVELVRFVARRLR